MNTNNNFSIESSNSYSRALYELSSENKCLDLIENQAVSLVKLIFESEDFNQLIKNPTIKYNDQINIINIISEKFKFDDLLKKFLNFLIFKRRLFYLKKILNDFLNICSNKRGEIQAKLTVAKELNSSEIERIKNQLNDTFGTNIKINYLYNPNLIGGLIIQVGSVMVDTSIKNKLQKIENKMVEV